MYVPGEAKVINGDKLFVLLNSTWFEVELHVPPLEIAAGTWNVELHIKVSSKIMEAAPPVMVKVVSFEQ